jgi:hypothetical protein
MFIVRGRIDAEDSTASIKFGIPISHQSLFLDLSKFYSV